MLALAFCSAFAKKSSKACLILLSTSSVGQIRHMICFLFFQFVMTLDSCSSERGVGRRAAGADALACWRLCKSGITIDFKMIPVYLDWPRGQILRACPAM